MEARIALEIELKLMARSSDLPPLKHALAALGTRQDSPSAAPVSTYLVSTYYDTAEFVLWRHRMILRVREDGGRFVQTVKTRDGGRGPDLLTRGEWEDAIAENRPDLAAPQSGPRLPPEIGNSLRPVFATAVTRTRIAVEPAPATQIEAAIDEGEISGEVGGAGRVEPISEVELELKRGAAAALYDIALRLLDTAPLAIETRSKAQRGYQLIAGEMAEAAAVRAEPLRLDPALALDAALQQVGRACLTHYLCNNPAALAGCAEGVHQMRVALRRLRSVVATFGKALPAADRDFLSDTLGWLDDALAPARNLDVLLGELVPPVRDALRDGSDLDPVVAALAAARQAAYGRLAEHLRSPRHSRAMLRLLQWCELQWCELQGCETGGPQGDAPAAARTVGDALPSLLERRFRAVRKRGKHFRRQTPKARHRLRIAVKKLRYAIELLGSPPARDGAKDFLKALRRLQDGLGYANDVRAACDLLREISVRETSAAAEPDSRLGRGGSLLLDWHERALAEREHELRAGLRRLKHSPRFWREPARAESP